MGSFQTPFETGQLSPLQQEGQNLFTASGCANCHSGMNFGGAPLFGGYFENPEALNAANIGLDVEYVDKGIGELNGKAEANGAFIIPSLRNLKYTGPYMHDGRYQTLREVIDHYNSGIKPSAALDHNLVDPATGTPVMMNFTEHDKVALEAFLLSLSEPSITTDVRFSNPFK